MALLTVGITCFNEGRLLSEAYESVRAQLFKDWECLLINDASQDEETNHICRQISDPRVRVVWRTENGGLSLARNTGVKEASTDWYVPLDADDLLPAQSLEHIARAIRANPDAGFIIGNGEAFGRYRAEVCPSQMKRRDILFGQPFFGTTPFHRRTWEAVSGFDQRSSRGNQDWDFWIGVLERDIPWVYVPETLYLYRAREDTMCQSYEMRWPEIVEYIYSKHRGFFDQHNAGRQFLANGYHRGAVSAHFSRQGPQARRWAWDAVLNGDRSRIIFSVLLKNILRLRRRQT